jgi:hypothetical protein
MNGIKGRGSVVCRVSALQCTSMQMRAEQSSLLCSYYTMHCITQRYMLSEAVMIETCAYSSIIGHTVFIIANYK